MRPNFRTIALPLGALLSLAGFAAACSSAPEPGETAAETAQAIVGAPTCPKGFRPQEQIDDEGPNGKPIVSWTCEPVTASEHTSAPTAGYTDTCGSRMIAVPATLPATCTLGTQIDGSYVFACPAGTAAPSSLVLSEPGGNCSRTDVEALFENCEEIQVIPSAVAPSLLSNCLGNPSSGWELIVDGVGVVIASDTDGGPSGGPCPGGCATGALSPPMGR
jgi:hypothetical protein